MTNIASPAASYWCKPAALGVGARTFVGTTDVTTLGADSPNANGLFVMSAVTATQFTLTAKGANEV